ncbi:MULTISPECIES: hypothetical protein [Vibrio harveyi group]|uniref:hypothetical protein n=1 Tax=Vibrio harveyi group TaxID=717610 RepID=UPI001110A58C|nr:hypothetical protein [Vibrio parahaemolyticus]MDG2761600.1 hypothetical protein [Vibrio parahaemolyticus]TMX40851.1 hypothetical protein DA098_03200 [Vibrio parahaemolyticus]TMX79844.1 hypothetical protein DA094_05000 [Vibrio parahaemolyticus]
MSDLVSAQHERLKLTLSKDDIECQEIVRVLESLFGRTKINVSKRILEIQAAHESSALWCRVFSSVKAGIDPLKHNEIDSVAKVIQSQLNEVKQAIETNKELYQLIFTHEKQLKETKSHQPKEYNMFDLHEKSDSDIVTMVTV